MEVMILIWPLCGIVAHIWQANEMKTWCGTPVWREPSTYVMFFPAMLAGPIVLFFLERFPER